MAHATQIGSLVEAWPKPKPAVVAPRLKAGGKFFFQGEQKFFVRGATYGAFRPDADGQEYQNLEVIERDFAHMAANGLNSVRIPHTMPPRSLLDAADRHGLKVMVGLSAEQYVGYLIDRRNSPDIEKIVREKVRACAGHPALLCYAIGNEIPAPVARWLGRRKVERYLERICDAIKAEDPRGLATYVNYPTTEYLQLPFLDIVSFNVYLESQERLTAYLARLQNIAGDRPLLMSEVGLDSLRNGEIAQASLLDWQIRTTFAAGCAGAFIFSWTDEWHRAGAEVEDWEFGITRRDRSPKPALVAVRQAFSEVPLRPDIKWPRISAVVCTYNGSRTIRECLEGLQKLDYPDFEVIVVDDGSTDATSAIAAEYNVRLIRTENFGLSNARNVGLNAATGEIVAYIDDDAYPDPHWLTYLASAFLNTSHAGIGGPNLPPPGDGPIADCVGNAPGGPTHVLLSDEIAEHIPGCNMAYRKSALAAIGGFDTQFRVAGDDVDVCWRLQEKGWTLGFSPAAQVWHHRRNSVRTYWKQQAGYGKAEALLEKKWPEKYNSVGHVTWAGRVYGRGLARVLGSRSRIYHGTWGAAPFQSLDEAGLSTLQSLPLIPEWYLVNLGLAALALLGMLWEPLLWAAPLLVVSAGLPLINCIRSAAHARFPSAPRGGVARLKLHVLTTLLYVMQPLARLYGRLKYGRKTWRRRVPLRMLLPRTRQSAVWCETWIEPERRLMAVYDALRAQEELVRRGGDFDRWDIEVRGGVTGAARMLMAVEDHGAGTQFVRVRCWPNIAPLAIVVVALLAALAALAGLGGSYLAAGVLGVIAGFIALQGLYESGAGTAALLKATGKASLEER